MARKVMGMLATNDFSKYATDLKKLDKLLSKEGINHRLRPHPSFVEERGAKDIIGYYPAGEWQIIIPDHSDWEVSIIRGMVSWGYYEAYYEGETYRFETPEEVLSWLKENYETKKTKA